GAAGKARAVGQWGEKWANGAEKGAAGGPGGAVWAAAGEGGRQRRHGARRGGIWGERWGKTAVCGAGRRNAGAKKRAQKSCAHAFEHESSKTQGKSAGLWRPGGFSGRGRPRAFRTRREMAAPAEPYC